MPATPIKSPKGRGKRVALVVGCTIFVAGAALLVGRRAQPLTPSAVPTAGTSTERKAPKTFREPEEMLSGPDGEIDYGVAALALTRRYVPNYDVAEGDRRLDEIAGRVRELLAKQSDSNEPLVRIAAINTVIYREYGFTYDLEDFPSQTPEKRLLGNLLRRGKGTCANLPDLYYAVAQRLGFPIQLVEAPQHAFLRYLLPDGSHINIEATAAGGTSSDEAYVAEMEISKAAIESGSMMRTLSKREALLLLVAEATWHDEQRGDFDAVLARQELLRRLRPNHAATFWNSAIYEAQKGKALQALSKSDTLASGFAQQAFDRARGFAKRATALGITKPDNSGDYVKRQAEIRLARKSEQGALLIAPESWDALAALDAYIASPRPAAVEDRLVAFRRPTVVSEIAPGAVADAVELDQLKAQNGMLPENQFRDPEAEAAWNIALAVDAHNRATQRPADVARTMEVLDAVDRFNRATGNAKVGAAQQMIEVKKRLLDPLPAAP